MKTVDSGGKVVSGEIREGYDGFISYSHNERDRRAAFAVRRGLERYAKRWNQRRALKIFHDDQSLSANPDLWTTIESQLARARWLILIASPEARASSGVRREVGWWLKNRSIETVLVVVAKGEIIEDDRDQGVDLVASNALPDVLARAYSRVPLWLDARWTSSESDPRLLEEKYLRLVKDLAPTLHEKSKEEMSGDADREHRRTLRVTRGAIALLVGLLVLAVAAAALAVVQRNIAVAENRKALARQLAANSNALLDSDLGLANLLAVQAHQLDNNPQTRSALVRAQHSNTSLERFLAFADRVNALQMADGGRIVVAGLRNGELIRRRVDATETAALSTLPAPVVAVASDADGAVVAGTDGTEIVAFKHETQLLHVQAPEGQDAKLVKVDPAGTMMVVQTEPNDLSSAPRQLLVYDLKGGAPTSMHLLGLGPLDIALSGDELTVLDPSSWQRLKLSDWTSVSGGNLENGVHQKAAGLSRNGEYFASINGVTDAPDLIPVWSASADFDPRRPQGNAFAPIEVPTELAISLDGRSLAVNDSGVIYVSDVGAAGADRPTAIELNGARNVNVGTLQFVGDTRHLAAASDDRVVLWNLDQASRSVRRIDVSVEGSCNACPLPALAVNPDEESVAAVGSTGTIVDIANPSSPAVFDALGFSVGPNLFWDEPGDNLYLPSTSDAASPHPGVTPIRLPKHLDGPEDSSVVIASSMLNDREIAAVDDLARIYIVDVGSPNAVQVRRAQVETTDFNRVPYDGVAIDPATELAAIVSPTGSTSVVDIRSGSTEHVIDSEQAQSVSYAGGRLLVQRSDGALEIWDKSGRALERTIAADSRYLVTTGSPSGSIVVRQRTDSSMILSDLESGFTLAVLPPGDRLGRKTRAVFGPDGQRLYIVTEAVFAANGRGRPGILEIVDLSDGALISGACRLAGRALTQRDWDGVTGTEPADDTLACSDQFVDQSSTTPRTSTLIASQSASASTASALAGTSVPAQGSESRTSSVSAMVVAAPSQSTSALPGTAPAGSVTTDDGAVGWSGAFDTPDGNMGCVQNIAQYESGGVVCFMWQQDFPALGCENLAFTTVYLELYGSPKISGCGTDLLTEFPDRETLPYGSAVVIGGVRCSVEPGDLVCINSVNRGFALNRTRYDPR